MSVRPRRWLSDPVCFNECRENKRKNMIVRKDSVPDEPRKTFKTAGNKNYSYRDTYSGYMHEQRRKSVDAFGVVHRELVPASLWKRYEESKTESGATKK
jgi:hypothetical protein